MRLLLSFLALYLTGYGMIMDTRVDTKSDTADDVELWDILAVFTFLTGSLGFIITGIVLFISIFI